MILLVNADDWLGQFIMKKMKKMDVGYIHIRSEDIIIKVSVASDEGGMYLYTEGTKLYFSNITGVYNGSGRMNSSPSLKCENYKDLNYINSSWNSFINFLLAEIPRSIGVLSHEMWSGSLFQLPTLYSVIARYHINCPRYFFNNCFSFKEYYRGGEYFFLSDFELSNNNFFSSQSESSVMAVKKEGKYWAYIMVLGDDCFSFIEKDESIIPFSLDHRIIEGINHFTKDHNINLCQFTMRLCDKTNKLFCYGIDFEISNNFQVFFEEELNISWQKVLLW